MRGHDRESTCGVPFPGTKLPYGQWTRTRVPLGGPGEPFDWGKAFGREAPRVLDLGCGNGRFLIASALARRDHDHLGIDLVPPAIRFASLRAGQRGLGNCKFAWGDAGEFVRERCPDASVAEVHLYHPQPYRDRTRADRRQLTPAVLAAVHQALVPGGLFVFQTDNPAYAAYARRVVPALFTWEESEEPWPDAPRGRTLREIVARAQGLTVVRATCRRLDLAPDEVTRRAARMPPPDFDAERPARPPAGARAGGGGAAGGRPRARGASRDLRSGPRAPGTGGPPPPGPPGPGAAGLSP